MRAPSLHIRMNMNPPARRVAAAVVAAGLVLFCLHTPQVLADVPAVTDFGQDAATPVVTSDDHGAQAIFLTLYADGREQWEVRQVREDAVVSFAGEHPVWRLDHGLMWFLHMPVYIREVGEQSRANQPMTV